MGHIRVKKESGKLFFDFSFLKTRCKEYTALPDTPANRKMLEKVMQKIEAEMTLGQFDYAKYFPNSKMLAKLQKVQSNAKSGVTKTPLFKDFAETWFSDYLPTWRAATSKGYRAYLDNRLIPHFGEKEVGDITKADILAYRSLTTKLANGKLKPKTINKFVKCLNMILSEAADRFDFTPPHLNIKPLKEEKVHIAPFSLHEVNRIISQVREDWRDYLLVRFFTGLRTGEVDGLKWKYVDFERRQILIRETYSAGVWEYTKNDGSQRAVDMSSLVYQCLLARKEAFKPQREELVFALKSGNPVHTPNFLRRVWSPLLRRLGIEYRKPYQTRHTAATIWLAAGENPNWIAMQMGHSSTQMLFTVYARYVPNLTHQDGSAMDRLLTSQISVGQDLLPENLRVRSEGDEVSLNDVEGGPQDAKGDDGAFWDQLLNDTVSINKGGDV
ncbi:site-specific integrase [Thiomicrospira microaerophila]|uniref:site-specific integrase n=1 Tax=Thiomicrospira microaerophila TaxID=406020 RepID=UPI0005C81B8B|nr:site-specific integrase [Thiomicrospira microaerophila]